MPRKIKKQQPLPEVDANVLRTPTNKPIPPFDIAPEQADGDVKKPKKQKLHHSDDDSPAREIENPFVSRSWSVASSSSSSSFSVTFSATKTGPTTRARSADPQVLPSKDVADRKTKTTKVEDAHCETAKSRILVRTSRSPTDDGGDGRAKDLVLYKDHGRFRLPKAHWTSEGYRADPELLNEDPLEDTFLLKSEKLNLGD